MVHDPTQGRDKGAAGIASGWLVRLAPPEGQTDIEPASDPSLLDRASRLVGPTPVRWATAVGGAAAERIAREVPEFSGGGQGFEILRIGTESSTLMSLLALAGHAEVTAVPAAALDGVVDFVRRGISLNSLLRGIRLGHAEISAAFLLGCESLVDPLERGDQVRYVSALLFEYIDNFAAAFTQRYAEEQARWSTSKAATRAELVRTILSSEEADLSSAFNILGYELAEEHIAVHLGLSAAGDVEGVHAQGLIAELLQRAGATQKLIIPVGGGRIWSWCSTSRSTLEVVAALTDADLPPDANVAVGERGRGPAGFRRTHRDASVTFELLQMLRRRGAVVAYHEVDLVSLLLADPIRAVEFVYRELGQLAAATDQARDLRQTVLVYLDEQSSPRSSAARLHVARNTITYRVHRAEEIMQRQIGDRRQQLYAALLLASVLPDFA